MTDAMPTGRIDWDAIRDATVRRDRRDDSPGRSLDSALDSGWADALLRRRADELARDETADADTAETVPLLVGRGAEALFGLELRRLARVLPLPRVARVPGGPPELLGLIAIDGRVMRLFDIDRLCGRQYAGAGLAGGGFAVVLRTESGRDGVRPVALRLATVETVAALPQALADTATAPREAGPFVTSITESRIMVLDVAAILDTLGSRGET